MPPSGTSETVEYSAHKRHAPAESVCVAGFENGEGGALIALSGRLRSVRRVLIPLALLAAIAFQGCVNQEGTFSFRLTNDTSQSVVDRGCNNHSCSSLGSAVTLKPGQSIQDATDPDGVVRSEKISSRSGTTLGCLPLRFSQTPPANTEVKISQMVPCRSSGGAGETGGRDWPLSR